MQKNIYLVFILISSGLVSNAQISKGSILLGGDINFNSQKSNIPSTPPSAYTNTSFNFAPSIGKALRDNLVVGIGLDYAHASMENTQGGGPASSKSDTYGANVFLRKYWPLGKSFSFFTQTSLGGNFFTTKVEGVVAARTQRIGLNLFPGFAYAVSRRVQVEIALFDLFNANYTHEKDGTDASGFTTSNVVGLGANLTNSFQNLQVGCKFVLGN